jgi:hypothetical protein
MVRLPRLLTPPAVVATCFVTFIDPTSAASFYALSNLQGLMIHNRRLKIGWGKQFVKLTKAQLFSRSVFTNSISPYSEKSWRRRSSVLNFGKDRCGNPPRQAGNTQNGQQNRNGAGMEGQSPEEEDTFCSG